MCKCINLKALMLLVIGLSLPAFTLHAQLRSKILHYSTEDGLSHERVTSIIKDKEGFIWFGTWDGINRFDGHNFITYKAQAGDKSSLKNNRIVRMTDDNHGHLWIKTNDKNIYRFDKQTGEFMPASKLFAANESSKYLFDKVLSFKNGSIWMLTKDHGVFCIMDCSNNSSKVLHFSNSELGTSKLPSNNINFFYEDAEGQLWLGTDKGLVTIIRKDSVFVAKRIDKNQLGSNFDFLAATQDYKNHLLYFTTSNGYLLVYNKHSGQATSHKIIANAELNCVYVSRKADVIYCTTSNGRLLVINLSDWRTLKNIIVGQGPVFSIYEDHNGLVWIEPEKHGVIKYNPQTGNSKYFNQQGDSNFDNGPEKYRVFEDTKGIVWVNMKNFGFGYYDYKKDVINYFHDSANPTDHHFSNLVNGLWYDPSGILWLSTDDRGVDKIIFQDDDFHQHSIVPGSVINSDNEVRTVYSDKEGRFWVATKQPKIIVTQNNKPTPVVFDHKPDGQIYSILEDHLGTIWMGTKSNGLYKADPVDNRRQKYKVTHFMSSKNGNDGLGSNVIYSLIEDKKGRIWVGSYGNGLTMISIKNNQPQFFTLKNAFRNYPKALYHKIRHLEFDTHDNLWIATIDGLLVANTNDDLQNMRFCSFGKIPGDNSSLGNNDVQYILRDSQNIMWLATAGGGFSRSIGSDPFKGLTFKTFTTKDGLPNDYVLSCVEDRSHHLWLSTQKGLSEFDPTKIKFRNFDSYDGLPKSSFSEGACVKLPNNQLIFGAVGGYISFNPDSIIDHRIDARMAFTDFRVNNNNILATSDKDAILKTDINNTASVTLQHDQNLIDIGYSMLDYRSSNKDIYAYRLIGADTGWTIDNKSRRRATFSYLSPGKYVFEVKSLNSDLYYHAPVKRLIINILPPAWRSWWAYTIYVIIILIIIELIRRTTLTVLKLRERIEVEKQLTELKISFFTNISHELRTPLTLILNPIQEISSKEKLSIKGIEHVKLIEKNANRMVNFINQLLDLRKMQNDKSSLQVTQIDIIAFIKKIKDFFADLALEKNISLIIESNLTELYAWVDVNKLDVVIYNLLANSFKFSDNGTTIIIIVDIDRNEKQFTIRINDQGIGVPDNQLVDIFEIYYEGGFAPNNPLKGTGIGLALAKQIVELHSGKIHAINNLDRGLSVIVKLHLGKEYLTGKSVIYTDQPNESKLSKQFIEELADQPTNNFINGDIHLPLILLVEDNYDLRLFLAGQLSSHYRVAEAENGFTGWEKALQLQPNLIISDVMMPEMDGIQLLDKLKNDKETSHIPIILLSAKSEIDDQIQGLRYGADYYITKPFNNQLILALADNLIRQRRQMLEKLMSGQKIVDLSPGQVLITSKDEEFLKKIIGIVEDSMANPDFNIELVAKSVCMSRSAFYKKFKALTNLSPVEFVCDMRLKRSLQFLDGGETDISCIAYSVGFSDPEYFRVCFKKHYYVTPSEYLKKRKLKSDLFPIDAA